ncbi:uncharacterized protein PAC_08732 [Phialocephala subalpina]|uniref:Uncharacterized protein n=1 Tax=Phialocephala subalpina TaxID=576137 RepID=A0A1L7X1F2_9HELO|nr:uncharacterized protein PAC_08732 [Phialocephala subalpina]
MTTNSCQNCPLLEVAKRTTEKEKSDWEIVEVSLENFLRQDDNDSRITLMWVLGASAYSVLGDGKLTKIVVAVMHALTKFASARDVDSRSWTSSSYLSCGGLDGADAQMATLAARTQSIGKADYLWYKLNIFTHWIPSSKRSIVIVFDPRPAVRERLPSPLLDFANSTDTTDPYWIHARFVEELVRVQDDAVWGIRNLVRKTEINRTTSTAPNPDYPRLHDIARHAIHISETLDLAIKTVDSMMTQHDQFLADRQALDNVLRITQSKIGKHMCFYHHTLNSLRCRSESNKERLLNEIQLAFNTVAQYDSQISVKIGRAAHSDSAAMKTIAFLTLTFFPATFISAIFSMSFFNYDPDSDRWTVSKQFWIYWVVAIPVTCVTALVWSFWHKLFPMKQIGDEDLQPRGPQLAKEI